MVSERIAEMEEIEEEEEREVIIRVIIEEIETEDRKEKEETDRIEVKEGTDRIEVREETDKIKVKEEIDKIEEIEEEMEKKEEEVIAIETIIIISDTMKKDNVQEEIEIEKERKRNMLINKQEKLPQINKIIKRK